MSQAAPRITLVQPPTVALRISGFSSAHFSDFAESGAYLGNVYRRIIPPSLPRVASVLESEGLGDVKIVDLRIAAYNREETYKQIDWEGLQVEARRVGASFSTADDAICDADWIGVSSHFTYESHVVRDFIAHAKKVNPSVKVLVGGADVIARPLDYLRFGADLAFIGDFNPQAFAAFDGTPRIVPAYRHEFRKLTKPSFAKLHRLADYDESHDGPVPAGVTSPIAFIYFTRGCPRECDFCESRRTGFDVLDLESAVTMLEYYYESGVRTLNLADDNILLLAAKEETRKHLLTVLKTMRELGFAWEYPNGLEIGRLIKGDVLDEELMESLFSHKVDPQSGKIVGAYRTYVPIETFDRRDHYSKLKPLHVQQRVIEWLASAGLPEIDFGVVIPPDADESTFQHTKEGYQNLKEVVSSRGNTLARYALFHLIPISLFRSMPTKYSMDQFPEGWNFYFPVYDGTNFSARELFEKRLQVVQEIDPNNFESMKIGQYAYA